MAANEAPQKVKKYRASVRALYNNPNAVTLVPLDLTARILPEKGFVSVALGETEVMRKLPEKKDQPARLLVSKPATQEQLAWLYNVEKHPLIEEYEE